MIERHVANREGCEREGGKAGPSAHAPLRIGDNLVGHDDSDAELRRAWRGAQGVRLKAQGVDTHCLARRGSRAGAHLVRQALKLAHEPPEMDLARAELPSALVLGAVEGGGAVDDEAGESARPARREVCWRPSAV